jgi:cell division protein FtsI/penicillin-binding protein 2
LGTAFGPTGDAALPGLIKSAFGQENVSASVLQMAMVAGTVADGGVEMTPLLMEQIRDSQGDLVEAYIPKPWMQPMSVQTAATLTTFMVAVSRPNAPSPGAVLRHMEAWSLKRRHSRSSY